MKKLLYAPAILLAICFLFLTIPVSASKPQEVVINFDLVFTGPFTAVGEVSMTGIDINDSGTASQVIRFSDEGTIQGEKVIVGQKGTVTLRFNAESTPNGEAIGNFVIRSGTGAYENIRGRGTTYAAITFENGIPKITGTYTGEAHIDP
jgi:hypothetical protein